MLSHDFPQPVSQPRILLLGASGFLAGELRRVFAKDGFRVRAVGSDELDLTSADASDHLVALLRSDDAVVMMAGLTPEKGRDVTTLMKNLRMAESVCAAIIHNPPTHFVYISSDSVYDAHYSSLLNEDSTCEPTDLYPLMHIARERMLEHACATAKTPFAVVRPCAIYGARDTHNSYGPNRFLRTALKDGRISLFGAGEERRHHIYVGDVATIVELCVLHRSRGIINAATGAAISFYELAKLIIEAIGFTISLEHLPRSAPITHRHFDTTALAKAFPNFAAKPLVEGIIETVVAIRDQQLVQLEEGTVSQAGLATTIKV
jgi:UDP-glucose 4-epimerase